MTSFAQSECNVLTMKSFNLSDEIYFNSYQEEMI